MDEAILPLEQLLPVGWSLEEISRRRGPPNMSRIGWRCILEGPDDCWTYSDGSYCMGDGDTLREAFEAAVAAAHERKP